MNFNIKAVSFASLAAIALLATPMGMVNAAQAEGGRRGHHLEQLDLTEAQRTEIEAIHTDARAQVQDLLTTEQQATLENSEVRGRRAFRQLDLSESQREQMRAIREDAREQISAILTDEQREQLEEMRVQRGERRGQGRPNAR